MRDGSRLDDLDRRLVQEMLEDPRVSYATLGLRLGVAAMTIRTRMGRLRRDGLLEIQARPNLAALGLTIQVIGFVQAEVAAIPAVIEVLKSSPATLRADRVAGEYDVCFAAAFATQRALGDLLHELQFEGVRRVVVHHQLEPLIETEGWEAAFRAPQASDVPRITVEGPGAVVPSHLRDAFEVATAWWDALGNGDFETLRQLSRPDIVYTVRRPQEYAGVMNGIDELIEHSRMASQSVRLRREVVRVTESDIPGFTLTIDAFGTVESGRGRARDLFGRLSFAVEGGLVSAAASLAELNLPSTDERAE